MRHQRSTRHAVILNQANIPAPGEHYGVPAKPYVYRGGDKSLGTCDHAAHEGPHIKGKRCVGWHK